MNIICQEVTPNEFTAYVDLLPDHVFTAKTRQAAINLAANNYFQQFSLPPSQLDYLRLSNQIHSVFMIVDLFLGQNSVIQSNPRLSRRLDNLFNRLLSLNEAVREEGEKTTKQLSQDS